MTTKRSTNIHILHRPETLILRPKELTTYRGVQIFSRAVRAYLARPTHTVKDLARKANRLPRTISNIASGETKEPRLTTILEVLSAMDYNIIEVRCDN